jgi:hypothetical protein
MTPRQRRIHRKLALMAALLPGEHQRSVRDRIDIPPAPGRQAAGSTFATTAAGEVARRAAEAATELRG